MFTVICVGVFAPLVVLLVAVLFTVSLFGPGLPPTIGVLHLVLVGVYVTAFVTVLKLRNMRWSRDDRFPAGLCPRCRYDLTGNISKVCPECGLQLGLVFQPSENPGDRS